MKICFIDKSGHKHCWTIPIYTIPVHWPPIGPGPVNYEALVQDVSILASVADVAKHVKDAKVRGALEAGLAAGLRAAQDHAGKDISIDMQAARG